MVSAILHRADPSVELTAGARDFRGLSLLECAQECLSWHGVGLRTLGRSEVAERALQTSSDFPLILADVVNKTLRRSYEAAPKTFKPLGRQVSLSDFRPAHRVKLGEAPQLEEIRESGEFTRGAMAESDETISLKSYGRIVGITRKIILNDDLGAFTRLPEMFGQSAANLESDIVWGAILANPTLLTDGIAVFHGSHANLIGAGSGAAPSVTSVGAGRVAMSKQTGLDGKTILNVRPRFLVVPTELEIPAQQLLFTITPNQTANVVPPAVQTLTPISEPRLSSGANRQSGSATAWYLFADPATVDTFEYAYMEGQDGPYTETRQGFDVDGMEVKCRHEFGAAWIDYRGAYKNSGA